MSAFRWSRPATALLVVALLAVALGGQAVTDSLAGGVADQADLLGRTGFAYLGGLRTFAAAVLWNRLDPQFHEYYPGDLESAEFMLPTMRMVTWLDPEFVEAYYVAPWILLQIDEPDESRRFALEGVANNPEAGVLWAQVAQFDLIAGDIQSAYENAKTAVGAEIEWRSDQEQFESYATLREVFLAAGDVDREIEVVERMRVLRGTIPGAEGEELDHDHDGDGVPDH